MRHHCYLVSMLLISIFCNTSNALHDDPQQWDPVVRLNAMGRMADGEADQKIKDGILNDDFDTLNEKNYQDFNDWKNSVIKDGRVNHWADFALLNPNLSRSKAKILGGLLASTDNKVQRKPGDKETFKTVYACANLFADNSIWQLYNGSSKNDERTKAVKEWLNTVWDLLDMGNPGETIQDKTVVHKTHTFVLAALGGYNRIVKWDMANVEGDVFQDLENYLADKGTKAIYRQNQKKDLKSFIGEVNKTYLEPLGEDLRSNRFHTKFPLPKTDSLTALMTKEYKASEKSWSKNIKNLVAEAKELGKQKNQVNAFLDLIPYVENVINEENFPAFKIKNYLSDKDQSWQSRFSSILTVLNGFDDQNKRDTLQLALLPFSQNAAAKDSLKDLIKSRHHMNQDLMDKNLDAFNAKLNELKAAKALYDAIQPALQAMKVLANNVNDSKKWKLSNSENLEIHEYGDGLQLWRTITGKVVTKDAVNEAVGALNQHFITKPVTDDITWFSLNVTDVFDFQDKMLEQIVALAKANGNNLLAENIGKDSKALLGERKKRHQDAKSLITAVASVHDDKTRLDVNDGAEIPFLYSNVAGLSESFIKGEALDDRHIDQVLSSLRYKKNPHNDVYGFKHFIQSAKGPLKDKLKLLAMETIKFLRQKQVQDKLEEASKNALVSELNEIGDKDFK